MIKYWLVWNSVVIAFGLLFIAVITLSGRASAQECTSLDEFMTYEESTEGFDLISAVPLPGNTNDYLLIAWLPDGNILVIPSKGDCISTTGLIAGNVPRSAV